MVKLGAMTNRFEDTYIWKKTLGARRGKDKHEKHRAFLRVAYDNFREKAKMLAGEIARFYPTLTVHDISHIDALWETADLITGDDFPLTPAEAFVLGGAFLIHDLGMGIAAFPKGMDEIKEEALWKDTIVSLLKDKLKRQPTTGEIKSAGEDLEKRTLEIVLRQLHAKQAEKLALISFKNPAKQDTFLIENDDLRNAYGRVIGQIAHSHGYPAEELQDRLPGSMGAPGMLSPEWVIDPIKLACIIRIADAIQIDDRRAPSFLRTLRSPTGYSEAHWNFQEKLFQPQLERDRLVFTAKSPFTIQEVDSWWVCHDTLRMIDHELKEVDSLLADTRRQRLKAIGVSSIEEPGRLTKLISVDGWQPVDTKVKVTDVAKLVITLGGEQLYGRNLAVPLRELIQNASDAIRARRLLENKGPEFGDIHVRLGRDPFGQYIEVEDNGTGMSPKVLTGPFLDFGQSFWGTSLMHEELPGLESKGFASTGKYGIGFFSVFMWGDRVTVASKRYEASWDSTTVLQFDKGVAARPIMRKATESEIVKDGGTKIRVWPKDERTIAHLLLKFAPGKTHRLTLAECIEGLCPAMDCNINAIENNSSKVSVKANDWLTMPGLSLVKRMISNPVYKALGKSEKQFLTDLAQNVRIIHEEDGTVVGLALLFRRMQNDQTNHLFKGIVTIGGMTASGLQGIVGILIGKSDRASRDIGIPLISEDTLARWISDQADLLSGLDLQPKDQQECAEIARACLGNTANLKFADTKAGTLNYEELKDFIRKSNFDEYLIVNDGLMDTYVKAYEGRFEAFENVIGTSTGSSSILQIDDRNRHIFWPEYDLEEDQWFDKKTLFGKVLEAFAEVWEKSISVIEKASLIENAQQEFEIQIGKVDGEAMLEVSGSTIRKPK